MTELEMRARITQYCDDKGCFECPFVGDGNWCDRYTGETLPREDLTSVMNEIGIPTEDVDTTTDETVIEHDVIKRPNHYCRDGAMECINEMIMVFGKEVVKHFALCNIWKYRYRSTAKNGEEDIKKSDQYIKIYEELCSDE